jgi:DNA modification methylase
MIKRIIKASSNKGDVVLDLFMGSGTTALACKELNRNFLGCDINSEYVEYSMERLKQF